MDASRTPQKIVITFIFFFLEKFPVKGSVGLEFLFDFLIRVKHSTDN